MLRIILLVSVSIFIETFSVFGQNNFSGIQEINAVCVSENDIWLATNAGVVRRNIDNNLFITVFNTTNSKVISNKILCIVPDDKYIWAGTDKGISKFDGYSWKSYTTDQDFVQLKVYDIAVGESELWLGTNEGLWKFKNGHMQRVFREQFNNQEVSNLFIDQQKRLWFIGKGEKKGLYKIESGRFQKITIPAQISIDYPILEQTPGELWFSGRGGVVQYIDGKFIEHSVNNPERDQNVKFLKIDQDNDIWFNIKSSVGCINPKTKVTKTFKVEQGSLMDIFFDQQDAYAICYNGVYAIHGQKLYPYPHNFEVDRYISAHYMDAGKNLLVLNNNLFSFYEGTFSTVIVDTLLSNNAMCYIREGKNKDVFIGTPMGVTVLKEGKTHHYPIAENKIHRFVDSAVYGFPKLPDMKYYNGSVFDNGRKCYWVSGDSLYKLFNNRWENQGFSTIQKTGDVKTVLVDKQDQIWALAMDSTVYHREQNAWVSYKPGRELYKELLFGFYVIDTTTVFAYPSGVSEYSKGTWKKYPTDLIRNLTTLYFDGKALWGDKLKENELIKFENNFWIRKKFTSLPGNDNKIVGAFNMDTTGTYLVTSRWIIKVTGKSYDNFFLPEEKDRINCYATDGKNRILVGMDNGLTLWTGKFWLSLTAQDGLPSNNITGLFLTSFDLLVISHTAGVSTIDLRVYE
jgi:ligand-binding sensor domain-containing protein